MFDDQILATQKVECETIAANLNSNNLGYAKEQYAEWKQQADVAIAAKRMAPPKAPYPMTAVVGNDAQGNFEVQWSQTPIFSEPAPVVVPKPQDTLSYTDSNGVKFHGTVVGVTPFGLAIKWEQVAS